MDNTPDPAVALLGRLEHSIAALEVYGAAKRWGIRRNTERRARSGGEIPEDPGNNAATVYERAHVMILETDCLPANLLAGLPIPGGPMLNLYELRARLRRHVQRAEPTVSEELPDLVTLDQAAAAVHRKKRTLERRKTAGTLPPPVVEGGGGRADLWDWKTLRPWLTAEFGVPLAEKYPRDH